MTNMKTTSLTIALKTDASNTPGEQWVHLLPSGEFKARDGRGPWLMDDPESVIQQTKLYAGINQLPVDYEHQIDLSAKNGQPAPAAGWIQGLQSRDDGIWGLVKWTDKATEFLSAKEYKYLSPVMNYTKDGNVVRIIRAALTNNPALEMTALAKAKDVKDNQNDSIKSDLSEISQLLGLDAQATVDDIFPAVKELLTSQNLAHNNPLEYVPLGEFKKVVSELQTINEKTLYAKVDEAIDKNMLPASLKSWGVSMCRTDSVAFDEFLSSISVIYGFMSKCQTDRLTDDEKALLTSGSTNNKTSDNEIYSTLGLTQDDINKYGDK